MEEKNQVDSQAVGLQAWQQRHYKHEHVCMRCGHKWKGMLKNPKVCNKCNSPYWNVPPTRSNAKGAKGAKGGGYIVVPVPRKIALGIKKEASLKGHKKLAPYFREKFKNLEKIDDEEYAKFKAEREAKNLPVVA